MTHAEIEELLGAYALDAVEPAEAALIEEHLAGCPRCREEVRQHREVAAMLGNAGAEAPPALWNQIAAQLAPEPPPADITAAIGIRRPDRRRATRRRMLVVAPLAGLAAAAIAVIAVLSFQLSHVENQVQSLKAGGVGAGVSVALSQPHRTVQLASAGQTLSATVIVSPSGQAYWLGSNMAELPSTRTYQLWGMTPGRAPVSLGLLGPDPAALAAFRVEAGTAVLLVTNERQGGAPQPTSPPLVQGALSGRSLTS